MSTIISASEITVRYGDRAVLNGTTRGPQQVERLGVSGRIGADHVLKLMVEVESFQHESKGHEELT